MEKLYYLMGERIASLRKEQRFTQEQLAEKLDISIKHMSEVERGLANLSLEKLVILCDILSTDLDYIVRGINRHQNSTSYIPDFVLELFEYSDSDQRELLVDYLLLFRRIIQENKNK